jgi:hypothetical protein
MNKCLWNEWTNFTSVFYPRPTFQAQDGGSHWLCSISIQMLLRCLKHIFHPNLVTFLQVLMVFKQWPPSWWVSQGECSESITWYSFVFSALRLIVFKREDMERMMFQNLVIHTGIQMLLLKICPGLIDLAPFIYYKLISSQIEKFAF